MYQYSNDFYERKINKRNHLIKRVRQNYVRDDISCGFKCCNEEIFEDFIVYVIPTKEVIEKYKSLLKSEFCKSIICQSVFLNLSLSDQKKVNNSFKHIFFYDNFFIETVNKGLEGVLKFYEKHIPNKKFDILNLENIKEYPKYFNFNKHIIDLCEDVYVKEETKFESYYDNLEELYNCGKIYKAQMMTDTFNWRNGTVIINSCKVRILGIEHMNRAVNGDEVYVEMIKNECFDFISEAEDEDEVKKHKLINNIVKVRSNADIDLFKNKNNASENENNKTTNSNQNNLLNILEPKEMFFGKVVGIYKRNKTSLVGTIINNTVNGEGTQNVLVLPIDKKYPPVMIRTSQIEELLNKRLWIELEFWEQDSKYPSGHYFKKLNKIGDIEGEIECILISNGITYFKDKWIDLFVKSTNFYDVETCKMLKNEISEFFNLNDIYSEVKNGIRKDFRNLKIISIDPKGCTDVDDALHINFLENGTFQVGVHIADVSHYVKLGSMLDKIASERGTTVYLPDRRIDMLPEFLSAGLCSLLEDQDRGAFSVIWELTSTGEIISTEFCKSLIHSHKAFSYDEALEILNSKTEVKYKKELEALFKISSNLRNRRMENGALDLSSEKVELKNKKIIVKEHICTYTLIEEFMLLANISVAEYIYKNCPESSILRKHPKPSEVDLPIRVDFKDSKDVNKVISELNVEHAEIFKKIITRSMNQATYVISSDSTDFYHYGLASPLYTHFTSPIRRYADILVHRILFNILQKNSLSEMSNDKRFKKINNEEFININQNIIDNLNKRHSSARRCAWDVNTLFIYLVISEIEPSTFAFVTDIKANGVLIYVPEYGINEAISTDKTYNVFDKINIKFLKDDERFYLKRRFNIQIID